MIENPVGRGALPLLEREAELAGIQALLRAIQDGLGGVVAIEGSPGIGKTRLLVEAIRGAQTAGIQVLAARAGEFEQGFGFGVVRQLFEPSLSSSPPAVRAELTSGAAGLAVPLLDASPQDAGEEVTSFAILHALYWLAVNIAHHQPALLTVDDLHWTDAPSLRWIGYLAHRLDGLPLGLIVTARPLQEGNDIDLVDRILLDPATDILRPERLGTDAILALVTDAFGASPDSEFVTACEVATRGNPLLARVLVDSLVREGVHPSSKQARRVHAIGPDAVARAVALRLARATPEVAAVIRTAAVMGDGARLRDLAAVAEIDIADATAAAASLIRLNLFREDDPITFEHPVVRTAVYEQLTAGDRSHTHRRAGEQLLHNGAPPEQAAAHLALTIPANDPFVAGTLRSAAERLLAQGAPYAAVPLLRRALEDSPAAAYPDALLLLGRAELHTEGEAAVNHLLQAVAMTGDGARTDVGYVYARALAFVGRWGEAVTTLLGLLSSDAAPSTQAGIEADAWMFSCADPQLHRTTTEGFPRADETRLGNSVGAMKLRAALATHEVFLGRSRATTVAYARHALAHGVLLGADEAMWVQIAGMALTMAGEFHAAELCFQGAFAEAQRRQSVPMLNLIVPSMAFLETQRGDLRTAEEALRLLDSAANDAGLSNPFYWAGHLGEVLAGQGRAEEARAVLEPCLPLLAEHATFTLFHQHAWARTEFAAGRFRVAAHWLTELGASMESLGIHNPAMFHWRSELAITRRLLDEHDDVRELVETELALARRWGAPRTIGVSLRALGLVHTGGAREPYLREAVDILERSSAQLDYGRALIDLGAELRRSNRRKDAQPLLRRGLDLADQAGAVSLAAHARDELAAIGVRARKSVRSGVHALTASERRVARMAAAPMTNKEIAQALFVTVKAVEMHLSNTYRKLDIASRDQLGIHVAELTSSDIPSRPQATVSQWSP